MRLHSAAYCWLAWHVLFSGTVSSRPPPPISLQLQFVLTRIAYCFQPRYFEGASESLSSEDDSEDEEKMLEREEQQRAALAAMPPPIPAFALQPEASLDDPLVGRTVAMQFGKEGVFFGLVTSLADGAYHILYPTDGQAEDVPAPELQKLLLQTRDDFQVESSPHSLGKIEAVLDRRHPVAAVTTDGAAGTASRGEWEYLVQWEGRGHWHDAWVTEPMLSTLARAKMQHFNRRYPKEEHPDEPGASAVGEGAVPLAWRTVQRLIAKRNERLGEPARGEAKGQHTEYLVKWHGLDYSHCTWELFSLQLGAQNLMDFEARQAARDGSAARAGQQEKRKKATSKRSAKKSEFTALEEQPVGMSGGTLYPFQLEALNWIRFSRSQGNNVILADEMGLGKTVVSMAVICDLHDTLRESCKPVLIVAPLSTLGNWEREAAFWAPHLNTVAYFGNQDARKIIRKYELGAVSANKLAQFDILLTSYELMTKDSADILKFDWGCLIVDEGHNRLKSQSSALFSALFPANTDHRILLTGTPLQNNLSELKSLLQFIQVREDVDALDIEVGDLSADRVQSIRKILAPHILRRKIQDVHLDMPAKQEVVVWCGLSTLQKSYLQWVLTRNFALLNHGLSGSSKRRLMNVAMECRKACNHPYLFPNAEPDFGPGDDDACRKQVHQSLISSSGKLMLLDKLLPELQASGHRVLIFSQMTRVLDLLQDYLAGSGMPAVRLDGTTSATERQVLIERFNKPNSPLFCFLLSTRAGGQGINLATADTVIIFDSDFNPHMDLQALARAYRIGQRRDVMVYRLVTRGTIEERVMQLSRKKLRLEKMIVRDKDHGEDSADTTKDGIASDAAALNRLLQHGTEQLFKDADMSAGQSEPVALASAMMDSSPDGALLYDKDGLRQLLDRSSISSSSASAEGETGVDSGESAATALMDSLKDARAWESKEEVAENSDEDHTDDDTDQENSHTFWKRLLEERYLAQQTNSAQELGRGKRDRKQLVSTTDDDYSSNEGSGDERPLVAVSSDTSIPSKKQKPSVKVATDTITSTARNYKSRPDYLCEDCQVKTPSFGFPADRKRRWCHHCAQQHGGAVLLKTRALCEDCNLVDPSFGRQGERKRRWCLGCAVQHPDAVCLKGSQGRPIGWSPATRAAVNASVYLPRGWTTHYPQHTDWDGPPTSHASRHASPNPMLPPPPVGPAPVYLPCSWATHYPQRYDGTGSNGNGPTPGGYSSHHAEPARAPVRPGSAPPRSGGRRPRPTCEDCHTKDPSFGMPDERKRRWCNTCGKYHPGAILLKKRSLCEDCLEKDKSHGLEIDRKRRWCYGCALHHPGAIKIKSSGSRNTVGRESTAPAKHPQNLELAIGSTPQSETTATKLTRETERKDTTDGFHRASSQQSRQGVATWCSREHRKCRVCRLGVGWCKYRGRSGHLPETPGAANSDTIDGLGAV